MAEQKSQEELNAQETQAAEQAEGANEECTQDAQEDVLAAAQAEAAKLKDEVLRAHAEMQNIRRRAEVDVEKAHKFGLEKFAMEMLATVDNLERALDACAVEGDATKAIHDGVEITLKALLSSLAKFKIEVINPVGEPFNPEFHQAITMVESADVAANSVLSVMQKGYTLYGRILRPAMVVVSKGASSTN